MTTVKMSTNTRNCRLQRKIVYGLWLYTYQARINTEFDSRELGYTINHCVITALFGVFWQLSNIKISNMFAGILNSPICLPLDGGLTYDIVIAYARLGPN